MCLPTMELSRGISIHIVSHTLILIAYAPYKALDFYLYLSFPFLRDILQLISAQEAVLLAVIASLELVRRPAFYGLRDLIKGRDG